MKKYYFLLIFLMVTAFNAQSQCTFFTNTQPTCDSLCDKFIGVWNNSNPGPFDVFIDGTYHSTISNQGSIGPLCPGTYIVFITDSASCNFTDTVVIGSWPPIEVNFTSQHPTCPTCSDGSITATVTGGATQWGYFISWSNGVFNNLTIDSLSAGSYCVTIEDSLGCLATFCDTIGFGAGTSLIAGTVFLDLDTNGIQNGFEPGISNVQIEVNPGSYSGWTSGSGTYFINVPNGTYTVSIVPPTNWIVSSIPLTYNVTVNDNVASGNVFGLLPDVSAPSAQVLLTADIPRCNWQSSYTISYKNTDLSYVDGEVIFELDPQVTYISASPAPTNVSGNTYTWNFNNLTPYQPNNINILVDMPATQGTVLNSSTTINLFDNASNIVFTDSDIMTQTVTCSWDPNDKLALPEGFGAQNIVPLNSISDYTIRFQNTGTDTAFVVIIKDTLSNLLDRNTFEILAASHEVNTEMDQNGILTFTFNNILLPDSNINEPGSHGFIRYSIKPVTPVADPTVITNTAYIYFDQNPAVITNTTLTTYSDNLLSITELNGAGIIKAYPNPFSNEVIIQFEKNVNVKADLYDYSGRIINNYLIKNSASFVINRQEMKPGIYLLKLTTDEGVSTLKLIVK